MRQLKKDNPDMIKTEPFLMATSEYNLHQFCSEKVNRINKLWL